MEVSDIYVQINSAIRLLWPPLCSRGGQLVQNAQELVIDFQVIEDDSGREFPFDSLNS